MECLLHFIGVMRSLGLFANIKTDLHKQAVEAYLQLLRNSQFLNLVTQTVTMTKKEFVMAKLEKYQRKQRSNNAEQTLSPHLFEAWKALNQGLSYIFSLFI